MKLINLIILGILIVSIKVFAIQINYKPINYEVFNDGHVIRVVPVEKKNSVVYKGRKYILKDVHIIINKDNPEDVEVRFLHVKQGGIGRNDKVLVLVSHIETGRKKNKTLEKIFSNLNMKIGLKVKLKLNVAELIPSNTKDFTVKEKPIHLPVYSEAIWVIFQHPVIISTQQKNELIDINRQLERFTNTPKN